MNAQITFTNLKESDFPLLLKWLMTPHVRNWWDQHIDWNLDLIKEKFGSYVDGYKIEAGKRKNISAYIIYIDNNPIGYIQLYNAHDFPRKKPLTNLPKSLAEFDIFIGELDGLGTGALAMKIFLEEYCKNYDAVFVDPDNNNFRAIKAYEKAGFKKIDEDKETGEVWMIRDRSA